MLIRLLVLALLVLAVVLVLRKLSPAPPVTRAALEPEPPPADRHGEAVAAAREAVQHAEAAHARAVATAQRRLDEAQALPESDARASQIVQAEQDLARAQADTEELDRARMTLEDLEGAGPLRRDLPSAPQETDDRAGEEVDDDGDGETEGPR